MSTTRDNPLNLKETCGECKFCMDKEYCVFFRQNVDCYQQKCKAFEKR